MTTANKISHQKAIEVIKIIIEAHGKCNSALYDQWQMQKVYHEKFARMEEPLKTIVRNTECDCKFERETDETLTLSEAIDALSAGHTSVSPKYAFKVCKALGIPYRKDWEYHGFTTFDGGFTMAEGHEGELIVDLGRVSDYAVSHFGLQVESYIGRGRQAQANSEAIAKYFKDKGKL
jgi:hypothetical protein